ncbi:MAG TPA: hypothetical protein V6C97_31190 [Oculatellaceae cyanobacterium]
MDRALENSASTNRSYTQAAVEAVEDFGRGFKDSALQPVEGLLQLAGIHKAPEPPAEKAQTSQAVEKSAEKTAEKSSPAGADSPQPEPSDKTASAATDKSESSKAYSAGAMVGQAFDFTLVQLLAKRIPGIGKLSSASTVLAGAGIGFLSANEAGHNSVGDRLESAAIGASTIGVMEGSNFALGKLGLKKTFGHSLIKASASGAITGAVTTQINTKFQTGHWASARETVSGATSWALTGVALGGISEAAVRGAKFLGRPSAIGPVSEEVGGTATKMDAPKGSSTADAHLIGTDQQDWGHARQTDAASGRPQIIALTPEAIQQLHPTLPPEHAQALSQAVTRLISEGNRPYTKDWNALVNDKFDPQVYVQVYKRLEAESERYAVLGQSKEEWLAKMAAHITRAFGPEADSWLDNEPLLKPRNKWPGSIDLGNTARRASNLPIPDSAVGEAMRSFLLRDHSLSNPQLAELSAHVAQEPAATQWLFSRPDSEVAAAARLWTQLPKLPASLAVEFANRTPMEQLTADLAWSNLAPSLTEAEKASVSTSFFSSESSLFEKFTSEYERLSTVDKLDVLQRVNNINYTVRELYPELTDSEALALANGARSAARDYGGTENASSLITKDFDAHEFTQVLSKLEKSTPQTVDIYTTYDKASRAFQLVKLFGADASTWLERNMTPEGTIKDPIAFASFKIPAVGNSELVRQFLLENESMSLKEITTMAQGLERVPSEARANVLTAMMHPSAVTESGAPISSSQAIRNAMKTWEIEPNVPYAIASQIGGQRSIENAAAIVAYRELVGIKIEPDTIEVVDLRDVPTPREVVTEPESTPPPVTPEVLAQRAAARQMGSTTQLTDSAFDAFHERYREVLARGKYQILAELQSLNGTVRTFHPSLSEREAGYMVQAAESRRGRPDGGQGLVHANVKAGTFAKVLYRLAGTTRGEGTDLPANLSWQPNSALAVTNVFGRDANQWLNMQTAKGLAMHDATQWLPLYSPSEAEGLGKFLLKNDWRQPRDLAMIARRWSTLTEAQRTQNFTKLVRELRSEMYPDAVSNSLVKEAARWDVNPADYKGYEDRYLNSLSTPPMVSPARIWRQGELQGHFLPRSDERGIFLGEHTNCCQHPGGAGAACAWFGQENERSGFFVVTDKAGNVVAQSWAWLSDKGGLVFDSLESKGLGSRAEDVAQVYQAAANDLSKEFGTVTLGIGTDRLNLSRWPDAGEDSQPLPSSYGKNYTDAREQKLLAKSEVQAKSENAKSELSGKSDLSSATTGSANALLSGPGTISLNDLAAAAPRRLANYTYRDQPGGAAIATQRPFVRTLHTDADWQQATTIAQSIYPEDFNYVSEGETTLLLDSPAGGVVGYATVNVTDHEINDLAVLPQFRPYSQTLMRGLYGYLKGVQTHPGEVWTATLRASTTDRLLNFYDRQGKIKILSRQVAENDMQGEPMYDVRFTLE